MTVNPRVLVLVSGLAVVLGTPGRAEESAPLASAPLLGDDASAARALELRVEHPPAGAVLGKSVCGAFVAGRASSRARRLGRYDAIVVIDTSASTFRPSGADIDGDGHVGQPKRGMIDYAPGLISTDPGDSVVAAEVGAARRLLAELDPGLTRVGVVTFAGFPDGTVPIGPVWGRTAVTRAPLTRDYAAVERALDWVLEDEPSGGTDMAAGLEHAVQELRGEGRSEADGSSRKVVLFFTDGKPTLPHGPEFWADNVREVLRAAADASRAGVRVFAFAIGPEALDGPIAAMEMASRTSGEFVPVRDVADVIEVVEMVSLAGVEEVRVESLTTGERAHPFRVTIDGAWAGFVRLRPGPNRIAVSAQTAQGREARETLEIRYDPERSGGDIPARLAPQRNRLLEECLDEARRARLAAERLRLRKLRKELRVEVERERARARERAAAQRKQLEIELGEPLP